MFYHPSVSSPWVFKTGGPITTATTVIILLDNGLLDNGATMHSKIRVIDTKITHPKITKENGDEHEPRTIHGNS